VRDEAVAVRHVLDGQHAVTDPDFAAFIAQQHHGDLALHLGHFADRVLHQLVAELVTTVRFGGRIDVGPVAMQPVGAKINRRAATAAAAVDHLAHLIDADRAGDLDHLARLGADQVADVGDLSGRGQQAIFLKPDHVGEGLRVLHHGQLLQPGLDLGKRNRVDRRAGADLRAAGAGDSRLPVHVYQAQHVAGIDAVRVLDLGIGLPDFRPEPGLGEEARRDVPERVSLLHHVGGRMVPAQLCREGKGGEGEKHGSQHCSKPFKHGCYPPDSPRQVTSI